MCQNTCVLSVKIHNNKTPDFEVIVLSRRNDDFWQKCSFYGVKPGGRGPWCSTIIYIYIYICIDITRFNNNNNNNCPPGPFRFLQRRVSLRTQLPPPPCGGSSLFPCYSVSPQSQPSRPPTLRHITFVQDYHCSHPMRGHIS